MKCWDFGVADATLSSQRAAQQDSSSMIAAIKAEGLRSTQATVLFHNVIDKIGPRLTGSPAHAAAHEEKAWSSLPADW